MKPKDVILATLFLGLIGTGLILGIKRKRSINQNKRYTIGSTLDARWTKNGRVVKYTFSYRDQDFESFSPLSSDPKIPGGKYLVVFSTKEPDYSKIYFDKPLPDDSDVPMDGWKTIPIQLLDEYYYQHHLK